MQISQNQYQILVYNSEILARKSTGVYFYLIA